MKTITLGEIADVIISGVDKKTKTGEKPVKLCNFTDIYYNWAITSEHYDTFMEATAKDAEIEKFSISKGQVAITKDSETRYDIGIPAYIAEDFDNVILGYHCALITPKPTKLYGKYLNAVLRTEYAKTYFANNATGSGQRYTISEETIRAFPLPNISLDEQRIIGDYLSDIDKKIANNRYQNTLIEQIVKQLFDYWFVQFEFPDSNRRPYKSSGGKMIHNDILNREIPEGWEVKPLEHILRPIQKRTNTKQAKSLNYAPIEAIPKRKMSFHECVSIEKAASGLCEFEKYDILLSNRRVYFHKVCIAAFDGITRDTVIVLRPQNDFSLGYCYEVVNTDHFIEFATRQSYGTEQPVLSWTSAKSYKIPYPGDELVKLFSQTVNDIIETVINNENEQRMLKALLTETLPLLAIGQTSINKAAYETVQ